MIPALLLFLLVSGPVYAGGSGLMHSAGGSVGAAGMEGDTGSMVSLEMTHSFFIIKPHLNIFSYGRAQWPLLFWMSWGGRHYRLDHESIATPYAEAGLWCFVNAGVGYSRHRGAGERGNASRHIFAGIPLPFPGTFSASNPMEKWYWQPYLRKSFSGAPFSEYGIMVKRAFGFR